jgi:hypothetical protein
MRNVSLALISLLWSLTSCNHRSENPIGKWNWHQVRLYTNADGSIDTSKNYYKGTNDGTIIFNKDGTGSWTLFANGKFKWAFTTSKKMFQFKWDGVKSKVSEKIIKSDNYEMVFLDTPYVKSYDGFIIGNVCIRK